MSHSRRAQRQMIAHRIADRLQAGELLIDQALHEFGSLCAELPQLRQEASLSAVFGQDLFKAAVDSYAAAVEARSAAVRLHNVMEAARQELKLQPVTATGGADKPSDPQQDLVLAVAA